MTDRQMHNILANLWLLAAIGFIATGHNAGVWSAIVMWAFNIWRTK